MVNREEKTRSDYRIELLGGLRLFRSEYLIRQVQPYRPGALLAYVAYHADRRHARDELVEVLWPDVDPTVGRNRLKQTLSALRDELGPDDADGILVADRASIRLNNERVTTDVSAFRAAHKQAARLSLGSQRIAALDLARNLYRGPLLPGFYDEWIGIERDRFAEMHADVLLDLARMLQEAGRCAEALDYARTAIAEDPLREESHCVLMRLFAQMGRSSDAVRQFHELDCLLKRELGERPSPDCIELLQEIRAGRIKAAEFGRALASVDTDRERTSGPGIEPVGGAVPLCSDYYVERTTDTEFYEALDRRDSIVLVQGPRQIGKTSLLARGLEHARSSGSRVFLTDLQHLTAGQMQSAPEMFLTIAESIAEQAGMKTSVRDAWNDDRGWNVNFERFLRREILAPDTSPIVWGLDEIDRLFPLPFSSEVFGLFRSWHNLRSLHPSGPWSRLTLAMAYATEAHLFITDINQSPFNVGTRLAFNDFTLQETAELNVRYGSPLKTFDEIARYHAIVGGCPFLVRRGLHEMVTRDLSLSHFEAIAFREDGLFRDHVRRLVSHVMADQALVRTVRDALERLPCSDADSFYRLRSAGVLTGEADASGFRCELYRTVFRRHLP